MAALTILQLIITLGTGVAAAFNKAGLAALATAVTNAITELQTVHDTAVTQAGIEALKITPQW